MKQSLRNIGIFAHVDAGKTSLTENLLYHSGAIKQIGSVDDGTTKTDFLEVEKERGISVKSSLSSFYWKDHKINLVDTPGHVDFSADLERVLMVIDAAVLVISAIDGVQSHTESIWMALKERGIPVLVFVNKIDRSGVYLEGMLEDLSNELGSGFVPLQEVISEGEESVAIQKIGINELDSNVEKLANFDDEILELFLEEKEIPNQKIEALFQSLVLDAKLFPMLFGSAKLQLGIADLLDAILKYFPPPYSKLENDNSEQELSALIYNFFHDPKLGKIAYARIFEGSIKVKEQILNFTKKNEEKVNRLYEVIAGTHLAVEHVQSGDIIAISGLTEAGTGDVLGSLSECIPANISLNASLLTVQIKAIEEKDYADLGLALQVLSVEDPALDFEWYKEEKELHVKVMGKIQIEVLEQIILQRFGIACAFEDPSVIYKETPAGSGYGIGHYTMPKPCWAIVQFLIEPGALGSGVVYKSLVRTSDVHRKYQNEVERTIPKALKQGIKGWEVTDLKITMVEGEDHQMHSRPGNFILATPMGIMNALNEIGTKFLEPIISFKITASDELLGKITAEIIRMRGEFDSPIIVNNKMTLTGKMPLSTSMDFPVKLSSLSGGKAKMNSKLHSYKECSDELGVERDFKGISPLDRSKYILKMRKALE